MVKALAETIRWIDSVEEAETLDEAKFHVIEVLLRTAGVWEKKDLYEPGMRKLLTDLIAKAKELG